MTRSGIFGKQCQAAYKDEMSRAQVQYLP